MTRVNKDDIREGLMQLGVAPGDVLFVHSSLKSFGHVLGGPGAVIDAMLEVVGKEGTLALPVFSNNTYPGSPPFEVKTAPSRVGLVTETFRQRPGVRRGNQPTHSVAASGAQADFITENYETLEPYDRRGAFGRMHELDTKIIFLGCGMWANSTLHVAEDWAELPYLGPQSSIIVDGKGQLRLVHLMKMPIGHRDFYKRGEENENTKVVRFLRAKGAIAFGQIGAARVQLIPMRTCIELCMERFKEEPDLLLCDNPDCDFCVASKTNLKGWKPNY